MFNDERYIKERVELLQLRYDLCVSYNKIKQLETENNQLKSKIKEMKNS